MSQSSSAPHDPSNDMILPFQIGDTAVRGRIVRMSGSIDKILGAHQFDENISRLVGEAAVVVTLMGAALKFDGKLIFQAQGDGPVSMVVADYLADGGLRATASLSENYHYDNQPFSLPALIGTGHIAMTVDQGPDMERYQGVTPLEGTSLEAAIVNYFQQSEQLPTAIRLAVGKVLKPGGREYWRAGGIIAQYVPGEGGNRERGEETIMEEDDRESWNRAEAFLSTTKADELLDPSLTSEDLLYRLFHEDGVRVFDAKPVIAQCACNAKKIESVLTRYDTDSLSNMIEDGVIKVTCDFCRASYVFDADGKPITADII